jgi:hypothetical protein
MLHIPEFQGISSTQGYWNMQHAAYSSKPPNPGGELILRSWQKGMKKD